jgi:hypothetical protein
VWEEKRTKESEAMVLYMCLSSGLLDARMITFLILIPLGTAISKSDPSDR